MRRALSRGDDPSRETLRLSPPGGRALIPITAWSVASSPQLAASIYTNRPAFWVLVIAQLGIVFALSARVDKLTPAASLLFIVQHRSR